jgi:Flp pilus assembly protein TadG
MLHRHAPALLKLSPGTFAILFGLLMTLLLLLIFTEKAG